MVWSSRRNVVSLLLGVGGLAALGVWRFARDGTEAKPRDRRFPKLLVRHGPRPAAIDPADQERIARNAVWLALATLSSDKRAELTEAIEALAASLEARHNPVLEDFLEEDPNEVLSSVLPWFLPVLNAARALRAGRWFGPKDALSVQVVSAQAAAPTDGARLVEAWPDERAASDAQATRARFLAWPVTSALLLDVGAKREAVGLATMLRSRVTRRDSALALVLDQAVQRRVDSFGDADKARKVFAHCSRLLERSTQDRGESLATAAQFVRAASLPPSPDVPAAWLPLSATELLVVPRLSALAKRKAFVSEVRRMLHTRGLASTTLENA